MGNSIIFIEVVGDHGAQRDVLAGNKVTHDPSDSSIDAQASRFVEQLKANSSVVTAQHIHWPDTTPIVDNLLTGIRGPGDFKATFAGDRMLALFEDASLPYGFASSGQYNTGLDEKREAVKAIARPYKLLAYELCLAVAAGPERTVALRDLLAARDGAVRALLFAPPAGKSIAP